MALVIALLVATSFWLEACGDHGSSSGLTELTISGSAHEARVRVEIADTPAELETGLSGRSSLPADQGMLFVIEQRGPGFWMKDTRIPLAVAFVNRCGNIVDIQEMEANSLDFHDTPQEFRFGLEVNKGWFSSHGISPGDRVQLPPDLRSSGCP